MEHDLITTITCNDLPVAAVQRTVGPPAVLDQPRLSHGVHLGAVDNDRPTLLVCGDAHAARNR